MNPIMIALACFVLLAAGQTSAFEFTSCDNGASTLKQAVIATCQDAKGAACQLKAGSHFDLYASFIGHKQFNGGQLQFEMDGGHGIFQVLGKGNACKFGVSCPSVADQKQAFDIDFTIPSFLANKNANFRFNLVSNDDDESKFCVQFPLNIQPAVEDQSKDFVAGGDQWITWNEPAEE